MTGIRRPATHSGACFSIIVLVRLIGIGLRVLLAPSLPELRLPALDDRAARRLYRSLVSVAALVIGAGLVATFLHDIGLAGAAPSSRRIRC